jgi:hypothetical protein
VLGMRQEAFNAISMTGLAVIFFVMHAVATRVEDPIILYEAYRFECFLFS